jgi:hypothetical protein
MIVPVSIHHHEVEELCYYDDWEKSVICDDYYNTFEYEVSEIEFDNADLEDIVDEYFDDIVDIILGDRRYREKLVKKMRSRRIDVSAIIDAKGEKNAKR